MRFKRGFNRINNGLRAVLLLMLLPTVCKAGGFALNEYAARANGMGGAMIAIADDASAVAYNPAGITQLQGDSAMLGMTAIAPVANVKAGQGATTTTQANIYTPPHAYVTYQAGERAWIGVGVFTRFGVGTQYGYDWVGSNNVYRVELSTYSLAPNLALKLTDSLSIGFGPELVFSGADLRSRPMIAPGVYRDQKINVDGFGIGFQIGLHYILNDQWSAGFMYHSTQKHTDKGNVKWQEAPGFWNGDISMSLTLPASYTLGVAYKPTKDWKIEADAVFTQWQDYEKLVYMYDRRPGTGVAGDITKEKNWRNVWRFQLGAEYMATDWLALRAGFVWDQDPIRKGYEDYMLPSSDRKIYSVGFGIIKEKVTYDFSLMYLRNNHRSIDANSSINGASEFSNSRAYMAGFSIGYAF